MRLVKKILKALFNIILLLSVLLVICVMYNFIQVIVLNKDYPELFSYTFFEVTTGSMKNEININDIIVVKITKDVKKGDIISFFDENKAIITHRVIEEGKDYLVTKGDANNYSDEPISKDAIIGRVDKILPSVGIWLKVFLDYKVIGAIIVTFILFGIALKDKNKKNRHSFSKFFKNMKGYFKDAKETKKED